MAGLIKLKKAINDIREKLGKTYNIIDFYEEYIVSQEIDLFFQIDCCICETIQRGLNDENLIVYKAYPFNGYARIKLENQLFDLIKGNESSISISSMTGVYNSHALKTKTILALLFSKDLDCDYYNSEDEKTIGSMISKDSLKSITLELNDLYLSKKQLNNFLIKLDQLNLEASLKTAIISDKESHKDKLHPKEEKSIGLIIAALAQLAKIDISHPHGEDLRDKLLPLIQTLDPDTKEMSTNTLGKFINFAVKHTNIKTKSET